MLLAPAIGKLDEAQPVARRDEAHRLGVDGDRAFDQQAGGKIFFMEMNCHDCSLSGMDSGGKQSAHGAATLSIQLRSTGRIQGRSDSETRCAPLCAKII